MVISNKNINPERGGKIRLFQGSDSAVHRNDEGNAFFFQFFNSLVIQAVTFITAVGNISFTGDTFRRKIVYQQACGSNAVDIIVSENCSFFAGQDSPTDTLSSL